MRTIDADALQGKEVRGTIGDISGDFIPAFEIALAPTIDAEPIRHGRWIKPVFVNGAYVFTCDQCVYGCTHGHTKTPIWDYCPNCGAKMDSGGRE